MISSDKKRKRNITRKLFMILATLSITTFIVIFLLLTTESTTEGKEVKTNNKYYSSMTVKGDDTLWDLSEKYSGEKESRSEYVDNIKKLNNMNNDVVYEGMNLIYYYYEDADCYMY